jgi:hypothetical protein
MPQEPNMMTNAPWDKIANTVEVHPTEVASYIQKGWVILMAYNARHDVTENTWARGYQENLVRCEYRPVVLMGQTRLDALDEENVRLREQVLKLTKIEADHTNLKRSHEALCKQAAHDAAHVRAMDERYNGEFKRAEIAEMQKRKLETDIGKIRAAIGDIRMRDIIDGART